LQLASFAATTNPTCPGHTVGVSYLRSCEVMPTLLLPSALYQRSTPILILLATMWCGQIVAMAVTMLDPFREQPILFPGRGSLIIVWIPGLPLPAGLVGSYLEVLAIEGRRS
jgi:hypothetical protein